MGINGCFSIEKYDADAELAILTLKFQLSWVNNQINMRSQLAELSTEMMRDELN